MEGNIQEEQHKLISVIIPIYNMEKYLSRAIKSIVNQTFKNIEIILVNDGSTDRSEEICKHYASKDNRIILVSKMNGGSSTARNAGLKIATGEYICFIDADDYLDIDALKYISVVIKNFNPDCIDFGLRYLSRTGAIGENRHIIEKEVLHNRDYIENKILPPLLNLCNEPNYFICDYVCNKIFRAEIIKGNKILFDEERRTWEDRVFLVEYLKYCSSFYSVEKTFYNYCDTPNSLSRQYDLQFFDIILENYSKYKMWFADKYDFNTEYVNNHWCRSIDNMIIRSLNEQDNKNLIRDNIIKTLQNQQVVEWYENRTEERQFNEKVVRLLKMEKYDKLIGLYRKKRRNNNVRRHYYSFTNRVRNFMFRMNKLNVIKERK